MNREIKFRGKRKDNGEWVYGLLVMGVFNDTMIQTHENGFYHTVVVIPETVGLFTNKLDSELRDVFEGDIVKGGNGKMWEVIYSLRVCGWIISNKRIKDNGRNKFAGNEEYSFDRYRQLCKSAAMDTFKKIGNIHDNPELLNPAKGAVNYNMNTNFDPGAKAEEVKDQPAEQATEQESAAAELAAQDQATGANESAEEGGVEG